MKMKILFVATEFAPGMIPFAATIINTLAKDDRFEVSAVVVNSGKYTYKGKIQSSVDVIYIEYPSSKLRKLLYKFYPYKIIKTIQSFDKNINPDIIHFLTGEFSLAPYILLKKNDKRYYYTVHDLHPHEIEKRSFVFFLFRSYILWGNRINRSKILNLTTSSYLQLNELEKLYPTKKIKFTHFPTLVTPQIAEGNLQVDELKSIDEYILFFGVINKYKGVDILVQAFNNSKILQNTKLVVAGKGFNYDTNNNPNIIRIDRFIDDSELACLFRKASFVVYPYRSATMSGVLSLAYFFNKKVLLSDIPFFQDNATNITTFFETGSVSDLQYKMEFLAENNLTEDKSCYNEIYSEKTLSQDFHRLYTSLF